MTDQATREIAEGLSEAQRRAILYLSDAVYPPRGWTLGPADWHHSNALVQMRKWPEPLVHSQPNPTRSQESAVSLRWRLTPLGLAVLKYLQKEGKA